MKKFFFRKMGFDDIQKKLDSLIICAYILCRQRDMRPETNETR